MLHRAFSYFALAFNLSTDTSVTLSDVCTSVETNVPLNSYFFPICETLD